MGIDTSRALVRILDRELSAINRLIGAVEEGSVEKGFCCKLRLEKFGRVYRDPKTASTVSWAALRRRDHRPVRSLVPAIDVGFIQRHLPRDYGIAAPTAAHIDIY